MPSGAGVGYMALLDLSKDLRDDGRDWIRFSLAPRCASGGRAFLKEVVICRFKGYIVSEVNQLYTTSAGWSSEVEFY
jgi:hypothetical protein